MTTLFVRLSIAPLLIGGVRKAANGLLIAPEAKVLQDAMSKASKQKDAQTVQALSVQLRALYKKHDASPFAQIKLPLISVPLFASFFFAIKAMANLPVPQFTVGGIPGWCEDLTLADPLYILPVVAAGMTSIMIHVSVSIPACSTSPSVSPDLVPKLTLPCLLPSPTLARSDRNCAQVPACEGPGDRGCDEVRYAAHGAHLWRILDRVLGPNHRRKGCRWFPIRQSSTWLSIVNLSPYICADM